ncbi:CocE/NonD family hydrolase C-terminal non-catalytic domain-containing protein [Streptomyces sp. L7]
MDGASQFLQASVPEAHSIASYDSLDDDGRATFDWRFEQTTEIVGHMKLRLYVAAESADDA